MGFSISVMCGGIIFQMRFVLGLKEMQCILEKKIDLGAAPDTVVDVTFQNVVAFPPYKWYTLTLFTRA